MSRPLNIGNVAARNRVFLAPMSGVSDLPFRRLAWEAGAGLVVSEMVASAELVNQRHESLRRLENVGTGLHVVQLAGRDAKWMSEAALIAEGEGADIIDINLGCPAKKVTGGYCGAALMREPSHALALIEAVVKSVSLPVTVKMRLGWDGESRNAPEIASAAQDAGVQMVTVHGRTRMQFYNGRADWSAIAQVREKISIPLVANGDVITLTDAVELLALSGADAVMVGRASYGAPWIAGEIAGRCTRPDNIARYVGAHYRAMLEHYGIGTGLRQARKHIDWYLQRHCNGLYSTDERMMLMTATSPEFVEMLFGDIFSRMGKES